MQRFYGIDLRVEADRLGVRRLRALIAGLPADAATRRAHTEAAWDQQHELTAAVLEVVDYWGRSMVATLIQLHVPRAKAQEALRAFPPPVRAPRPGQAGERKPQGRKQLSSPSEIRKFMQKVG